MSKKTKDNISKVIFGLVLVIAGAFLWSCGICIFNDMPTLWLVSQLLPVIALAGLLITIFCNSLKTKRVKSKGGV